MKEEFGNKCLEKRTLKKYKNHPRADVKHLDALPEVFVCDTEPNEITVIAPKKNLKKK